MELMQPEMHSPYALDSASVPLPWLQLMAHSLVKLAASSFGAGTPTQRAWQATMPSPEQAATHSDSGVVRATVGVAAFTADVPVEPSTLLDTEETSVCATTIMARGRMAKKRMLITLGDMK